MSINHVTWYKRYWTIPQNYLNLLYLTLAGPNENSSAPGKRKLTRPVYNLASRSEPHINFKDVSYLKNKTHELRVAKIQKSREQEAAKGERYLYIVVKTRLFINTGPPLPKIDFEK